MLSSPRAVEMETTRSHPGLVSIPWQSLGTCVAVTLGSSWHGVGRPGPLLGTCRAQGAPSAKMAQGHVCTGSAIARVVTGVVTGTRLSLEWGSRAGGAGVGAMRTAAARGQRVTGPCTALSRRLHPGLRPYPPSAQARSRLQAVLSLFISID
jgi:hypothetical protein